MFEYGGEERKKQKDYDKVMKKRNDLERQINELRETNTIFTNRNGRKIVSLPNFT